MPEQQTDANAYARKVLGMTDKRHPQETFPLPVEKVRLLCNAVLKTTPEAPPKKVPQMPTSPLPTATESLLGTLKVSGKMSLSDAQVMLGHKTLGTTKSLVVKLANEKKLLWDAETSTISEKA